MTFSHLYSMDSCINVDAQLSGTLYDVRPTDCSGSSVLYICAVNGIVVAV